MSEARAIYEAVLGAHPRHFDALHMLGVIAAQTGNYRSAVVRWLLDRDDSPWYRSVKLYRQSERREWGEVLKTVKRDLPGSLAPAATR